MASWLDAMTSAIKAPSVLQGFFLGPVAWLAWAMLGGWACKAASERNGRRP